jgi:Protein of unknown function (DUF2442)
MSIATIDIQPRVSDVKITEHQLSVRIQDGRTVSVPLTWYPRLLHASRKERNDWRVFEDTAGRDIVFWEQVDELIPVVALLTGARSRESKRSFERWLQQRKHAE